VREKELNIKNKKASFEYAFLEKYSAGIQLTGTEIKSIRDGKVNFTDSFCVIDNGEIFIKNLHIAQYTEGSYNNHEPKRTRKLLLTKKEIRKLSVKMKEKGLTIVPLRMFINERGFAKLDIALAKGKKSYDKRADLKEKDIQRAMKEY
jgi:SsrA-binding protein